MYAAAQAAASARRAWKKADAEVAALAKERGISKDAAWTEIQAEVLRQAGETAGRLTDPLGWRAASQAFEKAERDRAAEDARG